MPNNKSAAKRILISRRNRLQNRFYKSSSRTLIKMFQKQLKTSKLSKTSNDKKNTQILLNQIYSLIDKGAKRKVFHKNTAARKKSKLAAMLKAQ
uniref:Small ribosomal subunit protein bS20c n=1 Tax=Biddulphia biddulphiana TaxID=1158022 RepID=A0A2U9NSQ2_9STRA|nr:ribosomal protein S20 [Biddulphia biddulphiana]AWT40065.1 ribosomal protein S20 [Biddulphia biddulphiana]